MSWGDGLYLEELAKVRGIGLAFGGFVAFTGAAIACDAPRLNASAVESVTVQLDQRRPEIPLEEPGRITALVSLIRGPWAPAAAPASADGIIRFYTSGRVAASVKIAGDALFTDQCKRSLSDEEVETLFALLMEA